MMIQKNEDEKQAKHNFNVCMAGHSHIKLHIKKRNKKFQNLWACKVDCGLPQIDLLCLMNYVLLYTLKMQSPLIFLLCSEAIFFSLFFTLTNSAT